MIKTLRAGAASPAVRLCAATLLGAAFAHAHAEPTGGRVVAGSGSVATSGPGTTIQQNSNRLAIDWNSFSTRPGESVTFNQPGANAIALNRVVGPRPSALFGKLNANGQVFIVNPNGVIFGPGAQVNVGGLLASTLGLSTSDFMSGHYAFADSGRKDWRERHWHHDHDDGAAVVNLGSLTSAPGGYVALIGARAINAGTIDTPNGVAALAAGERVAVTLGDHGMIGLSVERGTLRALVANRGLIQADGGQAWLTANAEDALFASVVNNTGIIRARSAVSENGVIRLVAEGGVARVGGTLDASAPGGGNGGIIETTGTQVRVASDARITTAAAAGQTGTWRIASDFAALVGSGNRFGRRFGTIQGATLSRVLESTSVSISAAAPSGSQPFGFVLIDGPVAWRGANTLSLAAQSGIVLDAPITAPNGTLAMSTGGGVAQRAPVEAANVALQGGAGTYTLANTANRIGTLAADAASIVVNDAAPLTIGSVAGLAGVSASGAVTLAAPSLTLAAPVASRASGTAITLASASFDNRAGAQALAAPNGRWLVYSDSPDADGFGGLQSGNLALWGDSYTGGADARAASSGGNRFAFTALQQVTLTAVNIDVPFDTPRTLGPNDVTIALRYDGSNYGKAFADSPTVHEPFVFTVTSTGAAPGAASGEYIITITATGGPTGYRITTQSGTLRIAAAPTQPPPNTPNVPTTPVTPETPTSPLQPTQPTTAPEPLVTTATTLPGILDSVRTDAANPAHLSDATPGLEPGSAPLVRQRTDSSSDGSRLPDDAWPGHVCRM
ncbi:two-partner secretion domain-containing protein [Caballeronia ptereochthonis]|uniref:Filamentous hemagglutinin outer membrane protein n=1 Tax=Caballeronia ptereochthonis TaxID=1777144 RepID=A0A158ACF7_9BURK|nr:filamentous hemagglutinin N-terminal domain-containing protein [Caballeronia ptereochthonis]SAK54767.1 filamentous hemagglutinin outer membrane protein [Caballeronia ptereochthonis]